MSQHRKDKFPQLEMLTLKQVLSKNNPSSRGRFTPFVQHLLSLDSRFRLNVFGGETAEQGYGYCPSKQHIFFSYGMPTLHHEMAHFVEMKDPKRLLLPDWGMKPWLDDPTKSSLFAGFARECRVLGIQQHVDVPSRGRTRLANTFLADMLERALPFGKFTNMAQVIQWEKQIRESTHQQWSVDRIEQEWKDKLVVLQNWMESQNG